MLEEREGVVTRRGWRAGSPKMVAAESAAPAREAIPKFGQNRCAAMSCITSGGGTRTVFVLEPAKKPALIPATRVLSVHHCLI